MKSVSYNMWTSPAGLHGIRKIVGHNEFIKHYNGTLFYAPSTGNWSLNKGHGGKGLRGTLFPE